MKKEKKSIKKVLKISNEKLQALLQETGRMAKVGGWELDIETMKLEWTEQTYRIHELNGKAPLSLRSSIERYHPDDQPIITELLRECIDTGTTFDEEFRFITSNGRQLWVRIMGERRSNDGRSYIGGTIMDITDRKLTEISLQKTAEQLKEAQAIAQVGHWEWDIKQDEVTWSKELYRIMGVDPSEEPPDFEGNVNLLHPEDRENFKTSVQMALEHGTPYEMELRRISKQGFETPILAKGRLRKDEKGCATHLYGTVLDLTESKESERKVEAAHERLLNVLESTTDAFMELDENYIVTYINQEGLDSLLLEAKDLVGKNLWDVFPPPASINFKKKYDQAFREMVSIRFEEYFEPLDQWFEVNVHPQNKAICVYFNIITDRITQQNALKEAKTIAELANKSKSEFLANMSHEIRTPLSGIHGNLQLLGLSGLSKEHNQLVDAAMNSCDSLLTVIGDILDFSKIEAGQTEISKLSFSIESLFGSLKSTFSVIAQDKGIKLEFEIHPDTPSSVIGDIGRTRQVLFNLVGNAIKFTSEGSVIVQVKPLKDNDSTRLRLQFSVADTGIGIDNNLTDKLFEPFTQVDSSNTRQYQGTGLGLSIVKRLVDLMNGSIRIESKLGSGTTIVFDVLVDLPDEQNITHNKKVESPGRVNEAKESLNVLVVEDDLNNSLTMIKIIEVFKHRGFPAMNGKDALAELRKNSYDLILMDIQMPEMDGFMTTQAIRNLPEYSHVSDIPIIALTAHAITGYRERCIESGMNDYLAKPVSMKKLKETLLKYCK